MIYVYALINRVSANVFSVSRTVCFCSSLYW